MLGIRIDEELESQLDRMARMTSRTKSDLAREAIRRYVGTWDLAAEARRQSQLVAAGPEEAMPPYDETGWVGQ